MITINLDTLANNIAEIKRQIGNSKICAVVKANAYGHGAIVIAKAIEPYVSWFAVANIQEGIELRTSGITASNILVFGSDYFRGLSKIKDSSLTLCIYSIECLRKLSSELSHRQRFHIEVDTGMGRTGLLKEDLPEAILLLNGNENILIEGLYTHFSCANSDKNGFSKLQLEQFLTIKSFLQKSNTIPIITHISNSAGILTNYSQMELVRPGLLIYGISPIQELKLLKVSPILRWHTKPLQIKLIPRGSGVSYERTWIAENDSVIAIIPIGYADGYPRIISNVGYALVNGYKAPIVGMICMDFLMIDVSDCGDVGLSSDVVLVGRQGGLEVTVNELALWSNTIAYEILCNIGRRCDYRYCSKS